MKKFNPFNFSLTLTLALVIGCMLFSCKEGNTNFRSTIDLSGYWQFALDSANAGIKQEWYLSNLKDSIQLPGTTDLSHKGYKKIDTTTMHLNRIFMYEGPAWYRKIITIPEDWKERHVQLILERTKPTKIWIDGHYIGSSLLLESEQKHEASQFLTPGKHTLTICVNNNLKLTPYGNVHIYSDDTQTNWNGIIGSLRLEASDKTYIKTVNVYPDILTEKIKVQISLHNTLVLDNVDVELQLTKVVNGIKTNLKPTNHTIKYDSLLSLEYSVGDEMELWDEYHQPLYTLNTIVRKQGQFNDNLIVPFSMRKFDTKGTHFSINGRVTFLRGKHDACVFPLTGHPPMDTAGWIRVFKIAKSYGINHYRFHTWCPPAAAFEAADRIGIYLQPELPFWGGLESDTVAAMLQEEGIALLRSYANHPSFVMFSMGNEIWSGHDRVKKIVDALQKIDNRPLYTQGSNNSIGYLAPMEGTQYQTAARTPYAYDTTLTHTRLTQAFVDTKDGGILNTQVPSTLVNFDYAVAHTNVPLISHEVGQYQIFPDYAEINKYTGVLRASNLEIFRMRFEKSGIAAQNKDFTRASGALSVLCYRAEIEAALRTGGLAGFQLLDLQDFPGQGTALVGILDAFMDSKNVVTREGWLQFCNDVVPLVSFEKYCWVNTETFSATVQVANYSNNALKNKVTCSITDANTKILKTETFNNGAIPYGGLHTVGKIEFPLTALTGAQKLTVTLSIDGTAYKNSYSMWVYPPPTLPKIEDGLFVTSKLDHELFNKLKGGKKVLFLPTANALKKNSVAGLFPTEFWNYGMFKGISEWAKKPIAPGTMGILTNPQHPLFKNFPTDVYTNWQWWGIIKNSNSLNLNMTAKDYRPIVQVIDNLERNNKLGLIFEMRVGEGKLLVCTARLNYILDKPEASQLYNSIVRYVNSNDFNPSYKVDDKLLKELFQ